MKFIIFSVLFLLAFATTKDEDLVPHDGILAQTNINFAGDMYSLRTIFLGIQGIWLQLRMRKHNSITISRQQH